MPLLIGTEETGSMAEASAVPEAYARARALWATSTTAFAQGDVPKAAAGFVDVAYGLIGSAPSEHEGAYRASRCLAYENAASVWEQAGHPEAAEALLSAFRIRDPSCRITIQEALVRLSGGPVPGVAQMKTARTEEP
ncbi:MAG: hypothetical protein ACFB9M_02025 [Myxococcota bacterium]